MLSAYKCFSLLSLPLRQYSDPKIFYFKSPTSLQLSTDPQQTLQPQVPLLAAHSHAQSVRLSLVIISIDLWSEVLFNHVSICVSTSPRGDINFERTPSNAKALMKRKSPPRPPSTARSLFPFGGRHWGTVLGSHNIFHTALSAFQLHSPFPFACSFHLHEGNEPWPPGRKKKIFPSTLHVRHHKPTVRQGMTFSVHLDPNTGFCIWYENKIIFNLSSELGACEISSVGDKQLLLPLTLNQGDRSQKHSLEQLYLTSSPSGKSTPPSRLAINKPLPSFPLFPRSAHLCESHHFTVWRSRTPRSLSGRQMLYVRGGLSAFTLS